MTTMTTTRKSIRRATSVLGCVSLIACAGDDGTADGSRDARAGSDDETPGRAPTPNSEATPDSGVCATREVTTTAGGTLTAYPNITVDLLPTNYSLLSINYVITEDGDPRGPLLTTYAEIQNDGLELDCNFLPEMYMSGVEVIGLMETPPYRELSDFVEHTTLANCFGPGEIGVLKGVARGVTQGDLDTASYLTIDVTPNNVGFEYEVPLETPLVTPEIRQLEDGWALAGTVMPVEDVFNYGLVVYPRSLHGLIVNELWAYPNELDALYGGVAVDFETEATPCEFSDYTLMQSWIRGLP